MSYSTRNVKKIYRKLRFRRQFHIVLYESNCSAKFQCCNIYFGLVPCLVKKVAHPPPLDFTVKYLMFYSYRFFFFVNLIKLNSKLAWFWKIILTWNLLCFTEQILIYDFAGKSKLSHPRWKEKGTGAWIFVWSLWKVISKQKNLEKTLKVLLYGIKSFRM